MLAWSEFVFFNEEPSQELIDVWNQGVLQTIGVIAELGIFYMVPSAFLVGLVGLFGGQGLARHLLFGALTGYAIEGALVPTVYEAVPFSYLWTSVAWHGPITVALGVFVLPRLLAQASWVKLLLALLTLGVCWANWSTWVWAEEAFTPISAVNFGQFAAVTAAVMFVGNGVSLCSGWPRTAHPRWVSYVLLLPTLVLLVLQGAAVPVPAVGLFIILGLLFAALRWLGYKPADAYQARAARFAVLAVMPLTASLVYAWLLKFGAPLDTESLVFLTIVAGLAIWTFAVTRELVHSYLQKKQP